MKPKWTIKFPSTSTAMAETELRVEQEYKAPEREDQRERKLVEALALVVVAFLTFAFAAFSPSAFLKTAAFLEIGAVNTGVVVSRLGFGIKGAVPRLLHLSSVQKWPLGWRVLVGLYVSS